MKKILFAVKNMNVGGVEKSLLSLLNTLDRTEHEVDLLLLEEYGGDSLPEKQSNKIEIGIVVVFLMQYVTSLWVGETPGYYSVLFTCVLYTFAVGQGCISRVLSHPVFHKLAANSFAFYMIHELALRAFRSVFPEPAVFSMKDYLIRCMLIAVPALIISILFAWCYGQITNRKRM